MELLYRAYELAANVGRGPSSGAPSLFSFALLRIVGGYLASFKTLFETVEVRLELIELDLL